MAIGGGLAWGTSYLFGWITGTERAEQRLIAPASGSAGALAVRVDAVGVGAHTTQLQVSASNLADVPVTIPLFNNCQLVEAGRASLKAKVDFTTSVIDVPAGNVPITELIVFTGTPSERATSLTLVCSRLYWQGFGQPTSLQVANIRLHA